ncbi:TPA: single-stranded-DNA-specific exonuclease RecJ, partial [Streptococcus suis]|nr:single-stranded-DNA-specific exonuclease RecJ [Streptococcus suis]
MIKPNYDWQLLTGFSDEQFIKIAKKEGVDPVAAKLLYERGIHSAEDLHTFLQPSLEDLHDPYLLHDMDKAVERIRRAIEDYEQILIYGDYDADGMTSASILKETLEE